jgi:hypothetical protein
VVTGTLALARARLRNKGTLNIANIPEQTNPFATSVSKVGEELARWRRYLFLAQTKMSGAT